MEDLFVRWGKGRDAQTPDKSTDRSREAQSTENSTDRSREAQSTESRTDFSPEAQPPGGKTGLSRDAKRRPSRRNRRGKEAAQDSDQAKESIGKTRTQRTQDSGGKSRAVLAGCCTDLSPEKHARAMSELGGLADACGLEVVASVVQNAAQITHATYIGSGKVLELKKEIEQHDADIVIFNEALTPMQMRNLEKELDTEVLDRTGLILQIFSSRARTREAKLQVESARLQYMLPRLVGMRASLSRQGGGSGRLSNKGAGEQKLELDRRRIEKRIAELRRELEIVDRERSTQRSRRLRTGLTRVALVGYTNAGKSTVMNALLHYCGTNGMFGTVIMSGAGSSVSSVFSDSFSDSTSSSSASDSRGAVSAFSNQSFTSYNQSRSSASDSHGTNPVGGTDNTDGNQENNKLVFEADMLFATLDTSVRRIDAPGHIPFLLSDTVGFVSDLPHALVKAFRSTLDEVRYADLLLEVVDFSDPDYREQIEVTAKTLEEIGAGNIPVVYLYNKTDLAMAAETGIQGPAGPDQSASGPQTMPSSGISPGSKSRPVPAQIPFRRGETLYLAAGKGVGIPEILSLIDSAMEEDRVECSFCVPYTKGGLLQDMRRCAVLLSEHYLPEGTEVRIRCRREDAHRFRAQLKH